VPKNKNKVILHNVIHIR